LKGGIAIGLPVIGGSGTTHNAIFVENFNSHSLSSLP
jgi:hypothetical protein